MPYYFAERRLSTSERRDRGLVLILPGIESHSALTYNLAAGLDEGGVPYAIEVADWTTGVFFLSFYHLWARQRSQRAAQLVADRLTAYQQAYPGRPIHLVGYSGGGALAPLVLERLPEDFRVTSAVLLANALSRHYNLAPALRKTERGIWNLYSPLDVFVSLGTLIGTTLDGRHGCSAGAYGFRPPANLSPDDAAEYARLQQLCYGPRMAGSFNLGGHFGNMNRVFSAEWIAPLLK